MQEYSQISRFNDSVPDAGFSKIKLINGFIPDPRLAKLLKNCRGGFSSDPKVKTNYLQKRSQDQMSVISIISECYLVE